jgi:hypothetical protein
MLAVRAHRTDARTLDRRRKLRVQRCASPQLYPFDALAEQRGFETISVRRTSGPSDITRF